MKTTSHKRTISLLIALVMLMGCITIPAAAEGNGDTLPSVPEVTATSSDELGVTIRTYANFETAGVNLEFDQRLYDVTGVVNGEPFSGELTDVQDITAVLHYREYGTSDWYEGHPFSTYDKMHMATSLFNLETDTTYELRILVWKDSKLVFDNLDNLAVITTKPEFELPDWTAGEGWNIRNVSNITELRTAVSNAQAGDVILLAPGDYNLNDSAEAFMMTGKGSAAEGAKPIIITSAAQMSTVHGAVTIRDCKNVILHNVELTNLGTPSERDPKMKANLLVIEGASQYVTVSGCYIHDGFGGDFQADICVLGSNSITETHHLFINNTLAEDYHTYDDRWNYQGIDRTYYGIYFTDEYSRFNPGDHNMGGMYTVRNNTFIGFVDAVHSSGYYGNEAIFDGEETPRYVWSNGAKAIDTDDFLDTYHIQEVDVYDNIFYDTNDDSFETDGHGVNMRFFRNVSGLTHTAISNAQLYPGPSFYIENVFTNVDGTSLKNNTEVGVNDDTAWNKGYSEAVVNAYYYNNTFVTSDTDATNTGSLWQSYAARIVNMVVKNNIFVSSDLLRDESAGTGAHAGAKTTYHSRSVDYNIYHSTEGDVRWRIFTTSDWNPSPTVYSGIDAYKQNPRGEDQHSIYVENLNDLGLNLAPHADYPMRPWASYPDDGRIFMRDMSLAPNSVAIDAGEFIPGVSRSATPNIGANQAHNSNEAVPTVQRDPSKLYVIYNANGGTGAIPVDETEYSAGATANVIFPDTPPTKTGYVFAGWSLDEHELNWDTGGVTTVELGGSDITLYAIWKPIMYVSPMSINGVSATSNGIPATAPDLSTPGTITMSRAQAGETTAYHALFYPMNADASISGAVVNRIAVFPVGNLPSKNDVDWLAGGENPSPEIWLSGGDKALHSGDMIVMRMQDNNGTRLYQVWIVMIEDEALPDYTVTYYGADGITVHNKTYHSKNTTVNIDFSNPPTREHYAFVGWSTEKLTATPIYAPGDTTTFTITEHEVNLYPVWKPSSVYMDWLKIRGIEAELGVPAANPQDAVPGSIHLTIEQAADLRFYVHPTDGEWDPTQNDAEITYSLVGFAGMHKAVPYTAGTPVPHNGAVDNATNWVGGDRSKPYTFNDGDYMIIRVNWAENNDVRLYYVIYFHLTDLPDANIPFANVRVTRPVKGETPATTAIAGLPTFDVTAITWTPSTDTFAPGTAYTVTATLDAKEGYVFENTDFRVNSGAATAKSNDGKQAVITCQFPATEAEPGAIGGGGGSTNSSIRTTDLYGFKVTTPTISRPVISSEGAVLPSGGTIETDAGVLISAPALTLIKPNGTVVFPEDQAALLRVGHLSLPVPVGATLALSANAPLGITVVGDVSFLDVTTDDWFYDSVTAACGLRLFQGTPEQTFLPDTPMTRAMFAKVLASLGGVDLNRYTIAPFDDVADGQWYTSAIAWVAASGIINEGGTNIYNPDDVITREQMAAMLYKFVQNRRITLRENVQTTFTDSASISIWAEEGVYALSAAGVISGRGDGTFDPTATATRAEVCALLVKLLQSIS